MTARFDEADLVVNVVWLGLDYEYLRYFVASQMAHTTARYRYVVNACPPDQVARMRADAADDDQITEVLVVSDDVVAHGVALDRVRAVRDDGPVFAMVDPDILATGPFLGPLLAELEHAAVVTSGTEAWALEGDNVIPVDHPGVAGEHFYGRDGFVFGTPHLALYRRDVLDATCRRWGVGLGSAGPELSEEAREAMASVGQRQWIFDTAKIVNILLQADGHRLVHRDVEPLLHIGGMSHLLRDLVDLPAGATEHDVDWSVWGAETPRQRLACYTVGHLRWLMDGGPEPSAPEGEDPARLPRYDQVRRAVAEVVARHVQPGQRVEGGGGRG